MALEPREGREAGLPFTGESTWPWNDVYRAIFFDHPLPMYVFDPETLAFLEVNDAMVVKYGWSREELLGGMTLRDIRPVSELEALAADAGRLRLASGPASIPVGELRHATRDGRELAVEVFRHRITREGRMAWAVLANDVTERRRTEEELRLLQSVTAEIAGAADLDGALTATLREICATTKWPLGQAWAPGEAGHGLEWRAGWPDGDPALEWFKAESAAMRLEPGMELPGQVLASAAPVWLRNVTADTNSPRSRAAREAGLRAAVGIPILAEGRVVAVLEFFLRHERGEDGRLERLVASVAAQIGSALAHLAHRRRVEAQLRHYAYHDTLTSLPNRELFMDHLGRAIARAARRDGYQYAVLLMDVDRFKTVNDGLGHQAGDRVLMGVTARLQECLRPGDLLARFGGDEFAILLDDLRRSEDVEAAADRIHAALRAPFVVDGQEVFTAVSVGAAVGQTAHDRVESVLRDADAALSRAKGLGKGRTVVFDDELQVESRAVLQLENELRRAIERKELVVHYQPVVSLPGGRITSAEALIRWQHPRRSLLLPSQFIPLAEETGLIGMIGEWVLRTACDQARRWNGSARQARVSVNVSARQLLRQDLPGLVRSALRESGLPPTALQLEITESAAMENLAAGAEVLHEVADMGVELAIDDFGTAYASLHYLKRFPIRMLKVDRSFIRDASTSPDDAAIVRAIVAMGHSLGLRVVAEGVETGDQLAFVRAERCDEVQGFLVCHPLPGDDMGKLLARRRPFPALHAAAGRNGRPQAKAVARRRRVSRP